jgi:hypothetical protein
MTAAGARTNGDYDQRTHSEKIALYSASSANDRRMKNAPHLRQ